MGRQYQQQELLPGGASAALTCVWVDLRVRRELVFECTVKCVPTPRLHVPIQLHADAVRGVSLVQRQQAVGVEREGGVG